MGVYARRFAFDAKAPALAVTELEGFEYHLVIFGGSGGRSLTVLAHIARPAHALNETGAKFATP
jgi:hypothetical protein